MSYKPTQYFLIYENVITFLCPATKLLGALSVTPVRTSVPLRFPFNSLSFLEAIDFKFGNVVTDHKTQAKFDFDGEPIWCSRVMALDSLKIWHFSWFSFKNLSSLNQMISIFDTVKS